LYLQERLTFLLLTKEAAVALARGKHRPADDKAHSTDCAPLWGSPVRKSSCCARGCVGPTRARVGSNGLTQGIGAQDSGLTSAHCGRRVARARDPLSSAQIAVEMSFKVGAANRGFSRSVPRPPGWDSENIGEKQRPMSGFLFSRLSERPEARVAQSLRDLESPRPQGSSLGSLDGLASMVRHFVALSFFPPGLVELDHPLCSGGQTRLAGRWDLGLASLHALVARDDHGLGLGQLLLG